MVSAFILDSNGNALSPQLAFNGDNEAEWTLTSSGDLYIQVTGTMSGVTVFHLTATKNKGLTGEKHLFKVTDIVRSNIFKYFYLKSGGPNTLTVTV